MQGKRRHQFLHELLDLIGPYPVFIEVAYLAAWQQCKDEQAQGTALPSWSISPFRVCSSSIPSCSRCDATKSRASSDHENPALCKACFKASAMFEKLFCPLLREHVK